MTSHAHYWTLAAVAVGFVVVGHTLSQRRRPTANQRKHFASSGADLPPSMPLPPPQPRVFVARRQGGAPEAVRTGASFFSALAVNPTAECARLSGGHRLEGVTVAEQHDGTFLLAQAEEGAAAASDKVSVATSTNTAVTLAVQSQPSSSAMSPPTHTPDSNVVWRSKALPLENSAAWHSDEAELMNLPTKHPYCRASACVLAVYSDDESGGESGVGGRRGLRGGSVLLTHRRQDLRTFPGAWVLPGGGVDTGESLVACAQRELEEETGLVVSPDDLEPLCLWESFFPTSPADCFTAGTIGAHHLVVFFVAHLRSTTLPASEGTQTSAPSSSSSSSSSDCPAVTLQPCENDAFVWIPPAALPAFRDDSSNCRNGSSSGVGSSSKHTVAETGIVQVAECLFPQASASAPGMPPPTSNGASATATAAAPPAAPAVAVRGVEVAQLARQYSSAVAAAEGTLAAGTAEAHRFALREFAARLE